MKKLSRKCSGSTHIKLRNFFNHIIVNFKIKKLIFYVVSCANCDFMIEEYIVSNA